MNNLARIEALHAVDQHTSTHKQPPYELQRKKGLVSTCAQCAVDVAWTWSKRQDLADQLRSRVRRLTGQDPNPAEDRQVSPRTTVKAAGRKRVVDRLGDVGVRELIEARRAGAKLRELADKYGISESSVKRIIRSIDYAG